MQRDRADLASRIEALEILQDRIEQLERLRAGRPPALGLGLDQGRAIEAKLRERVLRRPRPGHAGAGRTGARSASWARSSAARRGCSRRRGAPAAAAPGAAPALYAAASADSVEDAYNALKTYLMLGDPARREAGHLNDQLARFWRGWLEAKRGDMPREHMIRSAERMIGFATAHLGDAAFPQLAVNAALVDRTRETLGRVVRGMPARERVYADVKARAATRFAPVTVARIVGDADREAVVGSHAVSGTFTREAWHGYVEGAFREAATRELQSADWVLRTAARDDLTLEGSPEQIPRALTELYKAEYVAEWRRFVQGVSVADFGAFDAAAARLDRLGDPAASPLRKVLQAVHEQTAWDGPPPSGAPRRGGAARRARLAQADRAAAGAGRRGSRAAGRRRAARRDGAAAGAGRARVRRRRAAAGAARRRPDAPGRLPRRAVEGARALRARRARRAIPGPARCASWRRRSPQAGRSWPTASGTSTSRCSPTPATPAARCCGRCWCGR